jgi:biotin transport system substrate-specific component
MSAVRTHETYADLIQTRVNAPAWVTNLLLVLAGSFLVAVCAQVAIPLPFSPVPITGQTFAVVLVGALLGSRRGALALVAYVLEGAVGLPVFANLRAGAGVIMGPTGGYILGFVVAAAATGFLAERGWDRRIATAVLAMTAGTVLIFACGLPWLAAYVGTTNVWAMGLIPFIPGAIVKLALAALVLPIGWRFMGRR